MPHPGTCCSHVSLDSLEADELIEQWDCDGCHQATAVYRLTEETDRGRQSISHQEHLVCGACGLAFLEERASGRPSTIGETFDDVDVPALPLRRSEAA